MWGGGAINTRQQDTTNLRLVYLFFEIGENNEFEEKTISHMCSYHDPHHGNRGAGKVKRGRLLGDILANYGEPLVMPPGQTPNA